MENYEEDIDALDDSGKRIMVRTGKYVTKERPKLNPEYEVSKKYVLRQDRPEWNSVGLLGQIELRNGSL